MAIRLGMKPTDQVTVKHTDNYKIASRKSRFLAFLLDFLFIVIGSQIIFWSLYLITYCLPETYRTLGAPNVSMWDCFNHLLLYMYWGFFSVSQGRTFGKRLLKIRTVSVKDKKISSTKIFIRDIIGKGLGLWVLSPLWMFFNKENKTGIDYLVGTIVVQYPDNPIEQSMSGDGNVL